MLGELENMTSELGDLFKGLFQSWKKNGQCRKNG